MTRPGLRLSPGGLVDLESVMEVMEHSFDPAFGEAWTAAQCAGLLPMPGVWLTVARDTTGMIGFSLARIVANEPNYSCSPFGLALKAEALGS